MENIMNAEHLTKIRQIANTGNILLIDAVQHYVEVNNLDPYFIGDVIQSDKEFLNEIKKNAGELHLLK